MTAPNNVAGSDGRVPLRLQMTQKPHSHPLDGGWWPQSRYLEVELADLVDHFPTAHGPCTVAASSPRSASPTYR